jgi:hypothetical protein
MPTNADIPARPRRRKHWERAFLEALARLGTITQAAEEAGVDRSTVYDLRAKAPDFGAAWDDARERCFDRLERLAMERVEQGWQEPVYQGGKCVGEITRFSERLHERLLESGGRFRRNVELSGPGGSPLSLGPNVVVVRRVVKSPQPAQPSRVQVPLTNGHQNGNGNGHAGH